MSFNKTSTVFILTWFFTCSVCFSQNSQELFGKNRIQYKKFDWKFLSTINFDVYYYQGGEELALNAARYAEEDFARITELIGFSPYSKMKLIVYNSVSDLKQSNIGLVEPNYMAGGHTSFVKAKLEIAFQGSQVKFKGEISQGVSSIMINIMMYGGSLREIVQSSYLLSLPEWFVNGAASYIAEGWSQEMDNYMREAFVNKTIKKPESFIGKSSSIAGQSVWNFIVEKYGEQNLANVLHLTQALRDEESGIEGTLGIPYSMFVKEWKEYYLSMANGLKGNYIQADINNRITCRKYKEFDYGNISLSKDGKHVVYSRNYKGKYVIFLMDLKKERNKRLYKGGYKLVNQIVDPYEPLCEWQNNSIVSFIYAKKEKVYLQTYDLDNKIRTKKLLKGLEQVYGYDISEDGNKLVLSMGKKGQSDIFLLDINSSSLKQITNDLYDDLDPRFTGGTEFVFCSNRLSDTLSSSAVPYKSISNSYNLFSSGIEGGDIINRLTANGNNTKPSPLDNNGNFIYLSSEKGIANLFKYNTANQEKTQVSNFLFNIEDFGFNSTAKNLVFSMLYKGKEQLYFYRDFDADLVVNTLPTYRQQKIYPDNEIEIVRKSGSKDSLTEGQIDINNYQFGTDQKNKTKEINFPSQFKIVKGNSLNDVNRKGPYRYKNLFSVDHLTSTLMVDPLKGMGILGEANMSDMFGNHRMIAGVFGLLDLKSSNLFAEYQYLKKRIDFKTRFDRETFYASNAGASQRYTLNRFAVTGSIPLSVTERLSFTPFILSTRFTDYDSLNISDVTSFYAGLRAEYVYDNTVILGMNIMEGTRSKITIEQYCNSIDKNKNFGKFTFDLRHYERIHREIIFATRASFGSFFGNSKKNFLLGGMDNWIFNNSSHPSTNDPLSIDKNRNNSDLLFVRYITNLRGFNYNAQNGSRFLLLNAEIRFPIIRYFHNGVIKSNFFKNLQLVTFTDIGSAWDGISPFNKNNSVNTQIVNSPPFNAKVVNYINPFLMGYGFGARTLLLGYYLKLDVGWGVIDRHVQKPKVYLTFGYDF
jgi:Tol biopolymer transport system component